MRPVSPTVGIEIDDQRFGHIIAMGALVGIPLVFLVSLVVALSGAGWPVAAGVAVVPALFGGPFVGGFVVLMRALSQSQSGAYASVTPLTSTEQRSAPASRAA